MYFQLTEEQSLIRDTVRAFAEKELAPSAAERDENERFDRELMFDKLAELGLTGIVFPEEYGGANRRHFVCTPVAGCESGLAVRHRRTEEKVSHADG